MASRNRSSSVQSERRRLAEQRGEPIRTVNRSLQSRGANNSLYVNVPELARDVLEFTKGDSVAVEQHDDCVVIRPQEE